MRNGEHEFYSLDEVHAFARSLSRDDLKRFTFRLVFGWRESLAATFGNPVRLRFRGWFKA